MELFKHLFDGLGHSDTGTFDRRVRLPHAATKPNGTGEFVRENVDLSRQVFAPPYVLEALGFGEFLPQLAQALFVSGSALWIKDFSSSAETLGVIVWLTRIVKGGSVSEFFTQVCTISDQSDNVNFLVRLLQEIGNVVQAAGIFESTSPAGKTYRPVFALGAKQIRSWGLRVRN